MIPLDFGRKPITHKKRLDVVMLERGFVTELAKAQALIMARQVVVGEHLVDKSGFQVSIDADIRIKGESLQFVSRGGLKLQHALDFFAVDVVGVAALDVGASTGGFTDCLLQRGAKQVFAVDVGHNQLAWKLRQDSRVINIEKTNIRYLKSEQIPTPVDIAVIDASFISLSKVLPPTIPFVKKGGVVICLVKPQFEVKRGEVGKGGIVRDPLLQKRVVDEIESLVVSLDLKSGGVTESPITGADGNHEFLMLIKIPEV